MHVCLNYHGTGHRTLPLTVIKYALSVQHCHDQHFSLLLIISSCRPCVSTRMYNRINNLNTCAF